MSGASIPKAVLASPGKEDRVETNPTSTLRRVYELVRTGAEQSLQDMQQNRIKLLRKEIDYLKETEWKYEPVDRHIGQSSH